jgi:hypothetical protein
MRYGSAVGPSGGVGMRRLRCRECHGRLRRLEGLALECRAGDLTATHSAKTRAIVVVPRLIFLGAKLTDRPGILPHESVVEYLQFADWN